MKKTLIALIALAACAQALETATYDDLLATETGWTNAYIRPNVRGKFVFDTTLQTLDLSNSNWGQEYAFTDLPHGLMATPDEALSFTCTITIDSSWDQAFSMYMVGPHQTMVIGTMYKSGDLYFGTTTATHAACGYGFGNWQGSAGYRVVSSATPTDGSLAQLFTSADIPVTLNISGTSVYNSDSGTYSMVVSCNGVSATFDLGTTPIITKVGFTADGNNNMHNGTIGGLSLSGVTPEPATATLSLLALAGLAARRRR